ncbi:hypothetical protein ACXYMX_07230 [Sporosarcina sp. CAU 1771]
MKNNLIFTSTLMIALILGACGSSDNNSKQTGNEQISPESEESQELEESKEPQDVAYHLPILSGWTEIQLEKKRIGNDTIDLWNAEFSFEGDMDTQLEHYISELEDMGFKVEIEKDEEFVKEVKFSKDEKGENHFGISTLRNNTVQSKSQIQPEN